MPHTLVSLDANHDGVLVRGSSGNGYHGEASAAVLVDSNFVGNGAGREDLSGL